MISIQVSIKEAAGKKRIEGGIESAWQPVEMVGNKALIWRPTQKEEFLAIPNRPEERQEEGVFIYDSPLIGGIIAVEIVSRGKAEVFIRKGENEICLIRRGSLKTVVPGIIAVPDESIGVEKKALIIFQELGKTADIFFRVDGKFSGEARIECMEK